jgi:hypothetical protein
VISTTKSGITWFNLRVVSVGGNLDVEMKRVMMKASMNDEAESKRCIIGHVIQMQ